MPRRSARSTSSRWVDARASHLERHTSRVTPRAPRATQRGTHTDAPQTPGGTMEQFVILIYQGTTPLPGTPEWDALPQGEQTQVYADYASFNQTPGMTAGPPLGLPVDARTVVGNDCHD